MNKAERTAVKKRQKGELRKEKKAGRETARITRGIKP